VECAFVIDEVTLYRVTLNCASVGESSDIQSVYERNSTNTLYMLTINDKLLFAKKFNTA